MENDKDIINRLKRVEGQVRGIIRMMEDGKDCKDVITQMTAARTAIDRAIGYTVSKNLEKCIYQHVEGKLADEKLINDAVELIVKSR